MGRARALALGAVVAAVAAFAPPTQASTTIGSLCDPLALSPLVAGSGPTGLAGRGLSGREPDTGQTPTDLPPGSKGRAGKGFKTTVPVYFHVITAGTSGAVSDAQIAAQIGVLNYTFGGREGGADTGFTFQLAGVTRTDDADWFYGKAGGTTEKEMKRTLHQGGAESLNVYSTDGGGYLGWAYLPDIVTKPGQEYVDGIVFDNRSIPGVSTEYAGRYDLGKTLTHETGHWLNLEHTFYGGCSAKGDFISDTPPEKTAASGCPVGRDTCTEPGDDPIHNYMDYSYDSCYSQFTAGQAQRMRDSWLLYRAGG